jgi:hypothetical protein
VLEVLTVGDNMNTVKITQVLIGTNQDVGSEVNTEETKCTLMSRH